MARLTILEYPDPRLRTKAAIVEHFDEALGMVIDNMFETMYEAPGIGLAATQVDYHHRIIVMDVTDDRTAPRVFINPEVLTVQGSISTEEGCLSVPTIYEDVQRSQTVRVRAQDRHGAVFEADLDEKEAVCLQHEMDHLDGKLFVDYLSDTKRALIRSKLEKRRRDHRAGKLRRSSGISKSLSA